MHRYAQIIRDQKPAPPHMPRSVMRQSKDNTDNATKCHRLQKHIPINSGASHSDLSNPKVKNHKAAKHPCLQKRAPRKPHTPLLPLEQRKGQHQGQNQQCNKTPTASRTKANPPQHAPLAHKQND